MENNNNLKIDFIGIGAPKCATSWIYQCLKEHPQVCVSNEKETMFFSRPSDYQKGTAYYKSFFNHCSEETIKGEFTADYLAAEGTANRIKSLFPDVKIIVCLRNPIDRAYSHFYYDIARGKRDESFDEALKKEPGYIDEGKYYIHLKKYFDLFPKGNILVLIYEDIEKDALKFIQKVYSFLNIKSDFVPASIEKKINLTSSNKLFVSWFNDVNLKKILKRLKGDTAGRFLIKAAKITGIASLVLFLKRKNLKGELDASQKPLEKPEMDESSRNYLRNVYKEEIISLEALISRDLSLWK